MTGFVYFLRCGDFVKIGYSATPDIRIRALRTGCPYPVELIGIHPGSLADEKYLHRRFSPVHHEREWFRLVDEIRHIALTGFTRVVVQPTKTGALARAVAMAGSQAELGRICGVSQVAICKAVRDGRCNPAWVPKIELALGIPRHELRPDLWFPSQREAA
jgi:DNA-binding transcriptional regulator YdaS (Cro superfamily)